MDEVNYPQLNDIAKRAAEVDEAVEALNDVAGRYDDGMQSLRDASEALANVVNKQNEIAASISELIGVLSTLDISTLSSGLVALRENSETTVSNTVEALKKADESARDIQDKVEVLQRTILKQADESARDIQDKIGTLQQTVPNIFNESLRNLEDKLGQSFDKQRGLSDTMIDSIGGIESKIDKIEVRIDELDDAIEESNKNISSISDTLKTVCDSTSTIGELLVRLNHKIDFIYERKLRKFYDGQ